MPVSITRVRSMSLQVDLDNDGFADSGVDIIRTTLVVTNSGASTADATNLIVNDPLNGLTLTGVVNISPLAFNDAFTAVGNTALRVGGAANIGSGPSSVVAGNLLTNDIGAVSGSDGVPGFTLVAASGTSAQGGTFNVFADGSFNYLNQAGDTGTDTFTYTIRDSGLDGIANNSDDLVSIGTVTITLTGEVWYINSGAAAGGTGTSANPFNSITAFNAANGGLGVDGTGDYIYVQGNAAGQLTLENSEHLIGTGSNLVVGGFTLANATGTRSDVTGASGFTVTLAGVGTGNEISGIDINGVGGISGTSFGSLLVTNATIDVSGQALSLNSGSINASSTGFVSTDSDGGTNNVALTAVNGTLALGSGATPGAMSGATGSSFLVNGGNVTTTYSGNISQASGGQALVNVSGTHTGTLTFSGTLSATNGTGLQFNDADGNYNFNGTNTLGGGDAGVDITNGSNGNFSFSSNSSITNPTGIAFLVSGTGAGNIDYNGTISKTSDGRVIDVSGHTGGTISFDGTVGSTGSSDGILLATNTGTAINFTNTLTLTTSASNSTAFSATGGGTITATAANNTISSGSGTGLNIQNTNIGLADVIFQSISTSGAANGINLSNTGTSASFGGLIITGDATTAANGSGGVIANSTGAGISLNSTRDVVLDQVNITGGGNDGITATSVVNFTLTRSNLTSNGNGDEEHGIDFTEATGNIVISDSVIRGSFEHNLKLTNTVGTIDLFNVKNTTFDHTSIPVSPAGGNGLLITLQGTAIMTNGSISGSTFRNNFSNGILVNTENSSRIGADNATSGSTTGFIVTGNTFDDNNIAIQFGVFHTSDMTVEISNNSIINDNRRATTAVGGTSTAIVVGTSSTSGAGATLNARIESNIIGSTSFAGSGSSVGNGIRLIIQGLADTTALINGNTIRETPQGFGMDIESLGSTSGTPPTSDVTVTNNSVLHTNIGFNPGVSDFPLPAIYISGDNQGTAGRLNVDVRGNTVPNATSYNFTGGMIELQEYTGPNGDLHLVDNPVGPGGQTATQQLQTSNTGTAAASAGVALDVTGALPQPPDLTAAPLQAGSPPPEAPDAPGASDPKGDATGGQFTPPPADPADPVVPPSNQPIVVDDGILSQAELNLIVDAAIQRWADAGASAADIAAMRAVSVSVASMSGLYLGSSDGGRITLDDNAAGFNWFIDTTPGDDSEYVLGDYGLVAIPGTVAAMRVDLLTTVMHELGHQIGLQDSYIPSDRGELMYGLIYPGERRLPDSDDAAASTGTPTDGTDFAVGPIGLGTLQPGQSVTVQWDSTVNPYNSQVIPTSSNVSTITYNDPAAQTVTSNANTLSFTGPNTANNIVLDSLTLGGTIWLDNGAGGGTLNNGVQDGAEAGITGVALSLYADADNNNVADGAAIATFTTLAGGAYSFGNLAPGNYIVTVDAANFTGGGVLVNRVTAPGTDDPDDNDNNDDNGIFGGGAVSSLAITLAQNTEPTLDASNKADINNTLDFGFAPLNQAPVNTVPLAQTTNEDTSKVFSTANGNLISISDVDVGTGNLTVTLSIADGALTPASGSGATIGGSGTNNVTITGTLTQVNAALNGLSYAPLLDANGSRTLTVTTNDNGNTGVDPGNTGGASDEQDSDPITINITAVNDAPTVIGATENSTTISEDQPLALGQSVSSLFLSHFSDAADQVAGGSSAHSFAGIAVTANASSGATGQWQYSTNGGGSWQDIGAATDATARLYNAGTLIRFNPTLDYNGAEPTLTVHLIDSSGAAITDNALVNLTGATGGTTRYSGGIVGLGGSITAVNDGPINAKPGTQTINEDATVTFSTAGGNAISVSDADAAPGTLTVTLAVLNGQLTLGGNFGLTFSGGSDGTDDTTMTFTGTATDINAALQGLLYETTLDYNGSDTLTITTNDNGNTGTPGALQDVDTVTINITAVADIATDTIPLNEDAGAVQLDLLGNDSFENAGRSITSVTQGLHGSVAINDNNSPGDTSDDYVIYTPVADYNGTDSFTYTVTSGGVTETATVNVNISAVADIVNDAPTLAEDSGTTTIDVIANDSFENGGFSITGVTQGLHGIVTIIDGPDADLNPDYVTYTPAADYNGPDSFTYTVTSGGVTETATVNVTVSAVADIADDSVTVLQDSAANALNLLANDTFESAGRAITAVGLALHGTTAINNNATPGNTADDYVTYMPTGGYNGPDTFTYTVTSGGVVETASVSVNVQSPSAPPVVDLDTTDGAASGDDTNLYVEDSFDSAIGTQIGITDPDTSTLASATVTITDAIAGDLLVAPGVLPPGITLSGASTATMLIFTGTASLASYEGLLGQVGYRNTTQDPSVGGTDTSRSITVVVNDSTVNSAPATMTMTIAGVNDAPTLTATGLSPIFTENGAAVDLFSTVAASTVETNQTLTSLTLTVSNVTDGAAEVLTFDGSAVALTHGNSVVGTATNGLTVNVTVAGNVATVTFSGAALSAAQVQTLVDGLAYANTSENPTDANRVVTITALVDSGPDAGDNENTAALSIVSTVNVNPVNDAATITGTITGDVTEAGGINNGTAGVPTASADLNAADPDNTADAWQSVGAGAATTNGYGSYALSAAGLWTYTLNDNNAAVQALFGAATLTDTFTVFSQDGTSQMITITIHAQDDGPTAQPDSFTITESGTIAGASLFINNGSGPDGDPDSPGAVTISAVNGSGANVNAPIVLASGAQLTVSSTGTFSYNPLGNFLTTPTLASGASNTPGHDSFTYTLTGGNTVTVSINLTGLDTNDVLYGTAGLDALAGGLGNDTYFVGNSGDTVTEAGSAGTDTVYALVTYQLAAGSEVETLSAANHLLTTALTLTGNEFANNVWGNNGANILDGDGGVDILVGFGGDDIFFVDNSADRVYENAGGGNDIVYSVASFVLAADSDIETLSAGNHSLTDPISLTGNGLNNNVWGNIGNNILNGGGGADLMQGFAGNDTYFIDNVGDRIFESAGGGNDIVYTSVSYQLEPDSYVETLSAANHSLTTALTLGGNAMNNSLWGNNGANTLNGREGADVLLGFGGIDTFAFTTALGGGNVDFIADFVSGVDKIALDDAIFTALGLGALPAGAFVIGTAAGDANDRIIYNNITGELFYDVDGNGAAAAVHFATLNGAVPIVASDFTVI